MRLQQLRLTCPCNLTCLPGAFQDPTLGAFPGAPNLQYLHEMTSSVGNFFMCRRRDCLYYYVKAQLIWVWAAGGDDPNKHIRVVVEWPHTPKLQARECAAQTWACSACGCACAVARQARRSRPAQLGPRQF
jgi:hypothetical protein